MSMIKCRECKADISTKAPVCPNCGARSKTREFARIFAFIIIIGFVAVSIVGYMRQRNSNGYTPAQSSGSSIFSPALPKMPVEVQERKAIIGDTYVVRIRNDSGKTLPVKVTLTSPTFNVTKSYTAVIAPNSYKEVGHTEGWAGAPGDKVVVESDGFEPMNATL